MKRIAAIATILILGTAAPWATHADDFDGCDRLLVLSAYPGEIDALLTEAQITETVTIDGRGFSVGTLRGNDVVLALSGIGLKQAERTARAALDLFACGGEQGLGGIVFSGVSGGRTNIGDVTIPERWTMDGLTTFDVDAEMYGLALAALENADLTLARDVPLGDVACVGIDPNAITHVTMEHQPVIVPGGTGRSSDPFNGRTFPCFPGSGNVFGCHPCRGAPLIPPDVERFAEDAIPFVDPAFFTDYFQPSPPTPGGPFAAGDMETAAVALVADEHGIPFIAFRALSDGAGDPLNLPGFPFQFFVYQQLAANNAAAVAKVFLEAWAARAG